jgi:hypothetical protein
MNRYSLLLATTACAFVTSCASVPTQTASADPDDAIVVTGSRLPSRDRGSSSSVKTIDNQSDVGGMLQRANPNNAAPMGGGR